MRTSFAHLVTPQVYVYIFGLIYIYKSYLYMYFNFWDKTYFSPYIFTGFPLWSINFFSIDFSPYSRKRVSFLSLTLYQRRKLHN